jgi:hypothetical protein
LQGCALSSNVIKLQVDPASGKLATQVVVRQPWLEVGGWALPQLPPLITDILISLDDNWLFFSNWLRGEGGWAEYARHLNRRQLLKDLSCPPAAAPFCMHDSSHMCSKH